MFINLIIKKQQLQISILLLYAISCVLKINKHWRLNKFYANYKSDWDKREKKKKSNNYELKHLLKTSCILNAVFGKINKTLYATWMHIAQTRADLQRLVIKSKNELFLSVICCCCCSHSLESITSLQLSVTILTLQPSKCICVALLLFLCSG